MIEIQSLTGNHNRESFDCNVSDLNNWLLQTALQHQAKGISRTFVAVDLEESNIVLGFYAMTACQIATDNLPDRFKKKLPRIVPGVKLGRLAVATQVQGRGLGELLLIDAIERTKRLSTQLGIHALFVDALDETAARFYRKYGFIPLMNNPLQLFLRV